MKELDHSYTNSKWQEKVLGPDRMAPDWAHLTSLLRCLFHQVSYACSCLVWVVRRELRERVLRGCVACPVVSARCSCLAARPKQQTWSSWRGRAGKGARDREKQPKCDGFTQIQTPPETKQDKLPLSQMHSRKVKWLLIGKSTLPCAANMFNRWTAAPDTS